MDLDQAQEHLLEVEQGWFLDTATGELRPEEDPGGGERRQPKAVRVARQIFD